jgi:hypothetical protein
MNLFEYLYSPAGYISRKLNIYEEVSKKKSKYLFKKYRKEIERNITLTNSTEKSECYLISSGNSIENFDLTILKNEVIIANNTTQIHQEFRGLNVDYFYISAPAFAIQQDNNKGFYVNKRIDNEKDLMRWLVKDSVPTTFCKMPSDMFFKIDSILSPDTKIVTNILSKNFIDKNNLFQNNEICYFLRNKTSSDICVDHSQPLFIPDGSIFGMIALALHLGFKKIYILGNDYTFDPPQLLHFYDSPWFSKNLGKDKALEFIKKFALFGDRNILSIKEDDFYYKPIFSRPTETMPDGHWGMHTLMNRFCESLNSHLINVVPEGITSMVYNSITWDEIKKVNI